MNYIVIDLEMNPLAKEYLKEKRVSKKEIIEIGAVLLNENFEETGNFMTYVKPEYNTVIAPAIEELTGITTDMVKDAPVFAEAMDRFLEWCASIEGEVEIYQWSDSDQNQLDRETELKEYVPKAENQKFAKNWIDFQSEYGEKLGVENRVSLETAMMYAGIDFVGQQHDALFDARNTGRLLHVLRDPKLCEKALSSVIEALTPKTIGTSLGAMFAGLHLEG